MNLDHQTCHLRTLWEIGSRCNQVLECTTPILGQIKIRTVCLKSKSLQDSLQASRIYSQTECSKNIRLTKVKWITKTFWISFLQWKTKSHLKVFNISGGSLMCFIKVLLTHLSLTCSLEPLSISFHYAFKMTTRLMILKMNSLIWLSQHCPIVSSQRT